MSRQTIVRLLLAVGFLLGSIGTAWALSPTAATLLSNSLQGGHAGGGMANSTNFRLVTTVGGAVNTNLSSPSFRLCNGFVCRAPAPVVTAPCATGPLPALITTNQTWCAANSPYQVNHHVIIEAGMTVTVEPGVTIKVDELDGKLTVRGTLRAIGTVINLITFTSATDAPGQNHWDQILFTPTSVNNVLDYVVISYAGDVAVGAALDIFTSSLLMTNSTIRHSASAALRVSDASPAIRAVSLLNNASSAVVLRDLSYPELQGLQAEGNGFNGVVVDAATVNQSYIWGDGLPAYRLLQNITVNEGMTLTIQPGSTVEIRHPVSDGLITIKGTLIAQGAANAPIRLTSGRDAPARGDWDGLLFTPQSKNNRLDNVTIEYGGNGVPAIEIHTSSFTLTNSTIRQHDHDAIVVQDAAPNITRNNIENNRGFGLRNRSATPIVEATCNWWGAASGPTHSSNSQGSGQPVSNGVRFDPWLTASAPAGACGTTRFYVYLPFVYRR